MYILILSANILKNKIKLDIYYNFNELNCHTYTKLSAKNEVKN